jgi:hypothetical protein
MHGQDLAILGKRIVAVPHENDWEAQGVVKRFFGFLRAEEFVKAAEEVAADPRFDSVRFVINDLLNVDGNDICERTIDDVVSIHLGAGFSNPNVRIAFVTTDEQLGAVAGRIKQLLSKGPREIKIFPTIEQARKWLESQPALLNPIFRPRLEIGG